MVNTRVSSRFLIGQDTLNGVWLPFLLPTGSQDSIAGQSGCNRAVCLTFHEPIPFYSEWLKQKGAGLHHFKEVVPEESFDDVLEY